MNQDQPQRPETSVPEFSRKVVPLDQARRRRAKVVPHEPDGARVARLSPDDLHQLEQYVIRAYMASMLEVPCVCCPEGIMYVKPKKTMPPRPFMMCSECRGQLHLHSTVAEKWLLDRAMAHYMEKHERGELG